tara:strand:+ start:746 stop:2008 length:1263 start_codon:yes stop_codon:yes gene_type:complete
VAAQRGPLIVAAFLAGLMSGSALSALAIAKDYPFGRLEVFSEALSLIHGRYVDERDAGELVDDAIVGLCRNLDDHSVFLDPQSYRALQEETAGQYFGIGVGLVSRAGLLIIERVVDGSPAEQAGIRAGDRIVTVDGEQLSPLSAEDGLRRIKGLRGSVVRLGVERGEPSELLEFAVRRDRVRTSSVESAFVGEGLLWVRIQRFQRRTVEELRRELQRSTAGKAALKGLVLDLRGNPGGYLKQAIAVADLWLASGHIVSTVERSVGLEREQATGPGTDPDTRLVVLVDAQTASAAEVVAGALRDRSRAILIGETSYGKGSVQQFFELSDGSALKLTTARYYTPSGASIAGVGVSPHVVLGQEPKDSAELSVGELLVRVESLAPWVREDRALSLALALLSDHPSVQGWWKILLAEEASERGS